VFSRVVPREVIKGAMCKLGVDKWLVSVYVAARTLHGNSDNFEVKVGMH